MPTGTRILVLTILAVSIIPFAFLIVDALRGDPEIISTPEPVVAPTPQVQPSSPPPAPQAEICPVEGAVEKLRAFNVVTQTFHHALSINVQGNSPSATATFEATMRDIVLFDGRLASVLDLVIEGQLPPGYFSSLLEEKRIGALIDTLRPCSIAVAPKSGT